MQTAEHPLLTENSVAERIGTAFTDFGLENKRLLVIIPDGTRSAPVDLFFRLFYRLYRSRVKSLDYLIALGTHQPMPEAEILKRVGISAEQKQSSYPDVRIMNHRWDRPDTFETIGTLSSREMGELTGGLMTEETPVSLNRVVFDYDAILIVGPVFPHEVVGFSGSNKYLFPGICGWNFIETTHWLAALRTNLETIGREDTPVRRLIDRAAELVRLPIVYFNLVVDSEGLKGLFTGDDKSAWQEAARLSSQLNVRTVDRPFTEVLSVASPKYDDLWTGAKAIYKIEPAVADSGHIVVYAPGISEISLTHNAVIRKIGLHVRDYFLADMSRFDGVSRTAMAYSTLVKGDGRYENGVEHPRIRVTLATGIPEEICRRVHISYRNPGEIDPRNWEEQGKAIVHDAGEVLYRTRE